jgi:hypothetical protein
VVSSLTIARRPNRAEGLDQQDLYRRGIDLVRFYAREVWTDHNIHDPGITTLELLCYALTDLAYRAGYGIEDLLAPADKAHPAKSTLYTARRILPNRPLTIADYRKLLIDLPGVKNAWLRPAELTYCADVVNAKLLHTHPGLPAIRPVQIHGLYEVLIDYMDAVVDADDRAAVLTRVQQVLQVNRNLCEDFVRFDAVATEDFVLCAEVDLDADADVAGVAATILFEVQQLLAPAVGNYSLSEILQRQKPDGSPYTVADAFEGPVLECGFIDDGELARADLQAEIHLSDVISVVMDIGGVRAVRDIVVNSLSAPGSAPVPPDNRWAVPVQAGHKALLRRDRSRLVFYKRGLPVVAAAEEVARRYAALAEAARAKMETPVEYDLPIPGGRYRDPAHYYSFQNHFPMTYGLSEFGLPGAAHARRQALVYQLKAYLLFFDQIMANYCAQLAHVPDLFSTDPHLSQSYFCQVVESFKEYGLIYGPGTDAAVLRQLSEDERLFLDRRNRFLDHLIARFGESFQEFAFTLQSAFGGRPTAAIISKCKFLDEYPQIGAGRSLAYNQALTAPSDLWETDNISGLERRIARLLGIRRTVRRNLSAIDATLIVEIEGSAGPGFGFTIRNHLTTEAILARIGTQPTEADAGAAANRVVVAAQRRSSYRPVPRSDGTFDFQIVDEAGTPIADGVANFASEAALRDGIEDVIEYLQEHFGEEGLYVIENILLRPPPGSSDDLFMPICSDPNCTDCADDDPYSYRLHVILPAFAGRFSDMEFRRFAERVIRAETPAHILPKICWIDPADMARVDGTYRRWLEARPGPSDTERAAALKALVDTLFSVKNVYPSSQLHDCDSGEDRPKFILGRTALGSMPDGTG